MPSNNDEFAFDDVMGWRTPSATTPTSSQADPARVEVDGTDSVAQTMQGRGRSRDWLLDRKIEKSPTTSARLSTATRAYLESLAPRQPRVPHRGMAVNDLPDDHRSTIAALARGVDRRAGVPPPPLPNTFYTRDTTWVGSGRAA